MVYLSDNLGGQVGVLISLLRDEAFSQKSVAGIGQDFLRSGGIDAFTTF